MFLLCGYGKNIEKKEMSRGKKFCNNCDAEVFAAAKYCNCGYNFSIKRVKVNLIDKERKALKQKIVYQRDKGRKECFSCGKMVALAIRDCPYCSYSFTEAKKLKNKKLEVKRIIKKYDKGLNKASRKGEGKKRAIKGYVFEDVVKKIVDYAWFYILGGDPKRLCIKKGRLYTNLITLEQFRNSEYYEILSSKEIKYIEENINSLKQQLSSDIRVFIDNKLVFVIEAKTYTEISMLKRVVEDLTNVVKEYPDITCYLFQLENALGGDFYILNDNSTGNMTVHRYLMECYERTGILALPSKNIVTFLPGKRNSSYPIHDLKFRKKLETKVIEKAAILISNDIKKYL